MTGGIDLFCSTEYSLRTICQLEKHFNKLEPKHKRKKLGGRMFSPPHKGPKTKKLVKLASEAFNVAFNRQVNT
jgi:hypothetical protein